MVVRPIDGNALHTVISAWPESIMYKDWVQSAIATAPTLTPKNEWVSVEERLPDPTYCVLVYTTDYSIEVDARGSDGEWMSHEVTHWMPLPAPPGKDINVPTTKAPNEPLTLEELREMDGDKINIHYIGACAGFYEDETAPYYGDHEKCIQRYNGMLRACDLPLKYYGTQWTATLYRCPPEGEEGWG